MLTKACSVCGVSKPLGQFARNRHRSDGHHSRCKGCANAARKNNTGVLRAAIKNGQLDVIDAHLPHKGSRILLKAAEYGQFSVVNRVLETGLKPGLDAALVATVMPKATIAVTNDNYRIATALLDAGADPDAVGGWSHDRALLWATAGGFSDLAHLLIDRGATLDVYALAGLGDKTQLSRLLKDDPQKAQTIGENGLMPLHHCARSALGNNDETVANGLVECARLLLDLDVEIDAPDQPPPTVKFPMRRTPLHWAASTGNLAVGRLLLGRGADVHKRSPSGMGTALGSAVRTCQLLAELLLRFGADIDGRDEEGATLLHHMSNKPHHQSAKWLLEHGADPNARMLDGRTPLHRAAERNTSARTAKLLVTSGAQVDIRDTMDMTPLDYAVEKRKPKVAEYLRSVVV